MPSRPSRRVTRSQKRLASQYDRPAARTAQQGKGTRGVARAFALALMAISVVLVLQFLTDGRFLVQHVDVQGALLVDADEVASEAALLYEPIFRVNARHVEAELVGTFGCFDRVRVLTRLPNRVTIQVIEKQAIVLWESGGRYWWVDAEGLVLGLAPGRGELPVLRDQGEIPVDAGEYIVGVSWEFVDQVVKALPHVAELQYTLEDGLVVLTRDNVPAYLGFAGHAEYKAMLLQELTLTLDARGSRVEYIDLKNERRPTVKSESG